MNDGLHLYRVHMVLDPIAQRTVFRAECACGWESKTSRHRPLAISRADQHVRDEAAWTAKRDAAQRKVSRKQGHR
jgi:hypothetical protein